MNRTLRILVLWAAAAALLALPSSALALGQSDFDASYGSGGVAATSITVSGAVRSAMQSDGKLVVGYQAKGSSTASVSRFTATGAPDTSFGAGGTATLPLLGGTDSNVARVLIAPDGTIYVAGYSDVGGNNRAAVWSLTSAGVLNTGFNSGGPQPGALLFPLVGASSNSIADAAFSTTGDILLVGHIDVGGDTSIYVRTVSPTGVAGATGTKTIPTIDLEPFAMTVASNGEVAVGAAISGTGVIFSAIFGFTAALAPDAAFGGGGGFAYFGLPIPGLGIQSRLFPIGSGFGALGHWGYSATLAEYTAAGAVNTALGPYGMTRSLPFGSAIAMFSDGGAVAGGKVAAVGIAVDSSPLAPIVMRFNADGKPDESFASGGAARIPLPVASDVGFVLQPDGKYVIVDLADDDSVVLARIWGDAPAPQPATAAFSAALKSKLRAAKARTIKGSTGGTGVTKVELAIQRVDAKLLRKSKKCTYVKSTRGATKNYKAVAGKCQPGVWLKAKGTAKWSLKLARSLPPGKYVFSARATGLLGVGAATSKAVTLTK